MNINLTLHVDDEDDADTGHSTGLTTEAFDRLMDALSSAGFSVEDGPDAA